MVRIAIAVLFGLLIVACGDGGGARPVPTIDTVPGADATALPGDKTATPAREATATPTAPAAGGDPQLGGATPSADTACTREETLTPVIAACEALAELFGRDLGEIDTVSVTPQEWPDACLGLPEAGEACAQVITPGYVVTLDLDGDVSVYRTDEGANVRLDSGDEAAP
ncbi:MAG: hypothetical protein IIB21_01270 [Chloroflexi bacterium]|nr:hypothetical protein [Chloroflexota bacterium]